MVRVITPEQFEEACRRFDLSYWAADDLATYKAGAESLRRLKAMAIELGVEQATVIFNRLVEERIEPHARSDYYWPTSVTV
jgi:hypothetical protein